MNNPAEPGRRGINRKALWSIIIGVLLLGATIVIVGLVLAVKIVQKSILNQAAIRQEATPDPVAEASKPVTLTANTLTEKDTTRRAREFRVRQWVQGYAENGRHDQPWDADATKMIKAWLFEYYGGDETNLPSAYELSSKLAKEPGCDDPLLLTVIALNSGELHEQISLLDRAIPAFENTRYRAYPRFYACLTLARFVNDHQRAGRLEEQAVQQFKQAFRDGSFTPKDQQEIAEMLLHAGPENFSMRIRPSFAPRCSRPGRILPGWLWSWRASTRSMRRGMRVVPAMRTPSRARAGRVSPTTLPARGKNLPPPGNCIRIIRSQPSA